MKKKVYILALTVALACSVVACGKKGNSKSDIRNDVLEFVNEELPAISADRDVAVNVYNAYFTLEKADKEQFLADLEQTAIPSMESYIDKLNKIEVDSDEAETLKNLLVQSAGKQKDALTMVVSALKEENPEYLTQADSMIQDSIDYMEQYEAQLKSICKDYDITLNGVDETVATPVDAAN